MYDLYAVVMYCGAIMNGYYFWRAPGLFVFVMTKIGFVSETRLSSKTVDFARLFVVELRISPPWECDRSHQWSHRLLSNSAEIERSLLRIHSHPEFGFVESW
jgi:hypothetical protein